MASVAVKNLFSQVHPKTEPARDAHHGRSSWVWVTVFNEKLCQDLVVQIWKPPVTIARALPRASPVRVMVIAAVPDAAPAVVRMIEVLVAVAAGVEVAVTPPVVVMALTVPKK